MAETGRKVFHMLAFAWYAFVIQSIAAKNGEAIPAGIFLYGGPWKYLTFLNLVLQMVFFGLAAVNDLQSSLGKGTAKQLNLCKDLLFSVFAFPVGMHTIVLPFLLGEILLQPHTFPKTRNALAALGIVGMAYLSWIIWVYLTVGIWVYPLLGLFSTPGLLGFFFCNMSIVTLFYLLGKTLDKRVWGRMAMSSTSSRGKRST